MGSLVSSDGGVAVANALMDEMANRLITPAPVAPDTSVVCPIAWAGSDGHNRSDYEPETVSIGPFHHHKPASEEKKKDVLHAHLPRHDEANRRAELARYLGAMERIVPRARGFYSRSFDDWLSSKEFACMLLLDGCFLHSRFITNHLDPELDLDEDINFDRDVVFLLENQIPLFVLVEIHNLIVTTGSAAASADEDRNYYESFVMRKLVERVEALVRRNEYSTITLSPFTGPLHVLPCHLLHLLYMYFRPTALSLEALDHHQQQQPAVQQPVAAAGDVVVNVNVGRPDPIRQFRWRSAIEYYTAGVRFEMLDLVSGSSGGGGVNAPRSILDVELTAGGTLRIPCLTMDKNTGRMLRNMVALEQTRPAAPPGQERSSSHSHHVTAYCFFLSQLAATDKDVDLLKAKGIIAHLFHDSSQAAKVLAELCDGVVINAYDHDLSYLKCHHEALEKLCQDGWGKSMAWLRHIKCSNYLMTLGVVAVVVVFLCTVEQSVIAALSYVGNGALG